MKNPVLQPWSVSKTKEGPKIPLFKVDLTTFVNPRNGFELEAVVLHARHTINVVCLTTENQLVLVEQFRFGAGKFFTELPAGIIDEGEEPLQAAKRELIEETGFISQEWSLLGTSYINPSYVDNVCHHYLARNAKFSGVVANEDSEDIAVRLHPFVNRNNLLSDGTIADAMTRAALCMLDAVKRFP